jgi:hypothetical protein
MRIERWEQELSWVLFPARVATIALGVLGLIGALLAVTGIFGMASYAVSKRLRELGLRVALGANQPQVLKARSSAHSACWPSARVQGLYSECWLLRCWRTSSIRQRRKIRWCWVAWFWRCSSLACWRHGFQHSAPSASIR